MRTLNYHFNLFADSPESAKHVTRDVPELHDISMLPQTVQDAIIKHMAYPEPVLLEHLKIGSTPPFGKRNRLLDMSRNILNAMFGTTYIVL